MKAISSKWRLLWLNGGALFIGFAVGYFIREARNTVEGKHAENRLAMASPSPVNSGDRRSARAFSAKGESERDRSEVANLQLHLAEEKSMRRKLSQELLRPMTSPDELEVSNFLSSLRTKKNEVAPALNLNPK